MSDEATPAASSDAEADLRQQQALGRAVADCLDRLATPALVIDLDAVDHNVAAMLRRVGDPSRWRPHVKTVKQPTLVGALLDAGVHRFKAATPAEVAMVLDAASSRALARPLEVLLAYPAAPPQLRAMLELRRRHPHARLGLLADDPEHVAALVEGIGRPDELPAFDLWLDVDLGMNRTGSAPARWRDAALPASPWLHPVGLHGYDGHRRVSERDPAHAGYDALVELARRGPFVPEQIVTSGTHSYGHALAHAALTGGPWSHQVSPGTIVLSDRRSMAAAADLGLRQAAFVATRVVARPGEDRITLDAGSKAIAPDCPAPGCAVLGHPELCPLTASEEHRPVQVTAGPRPPRGTVLFLVPDHVCTTVNLHAEALYVRGDAIVGSAPVVARGHRPWLSLQALLAAILVPWLSACQPIVTEVPVTLLLPPDDAELQRTNNVSLVLEPDGVSDTIATDGLDFVLSFEVPPDGTTRTLSIFLAEDDTLLAWGRTPPFTYGGASQGLALLAARPGRLTPLDIEFGSPDPDARVAALGDLGALVLASDGGALFFDAYQYTVRAVASLADPPAVSDGQLLPTADGTVVRAAWNDGPAAWRFDPVVDQWDAIELQGDLRPRAGAAWWPSPDRQSLRLYGGGQTDDVVELSLLGDDPRDVTIVDGLRMDGPRPGATVVVLDGQAVVVGGSDPALPLAWRPAAQAGEGAAAAWTELRCVVAPNDAAAALCVGGLRDGQPTADAVGLRLAGDSLGVEIHPALLSVPMAAPQVFADAQAVYAQGGGRWLLIADDLTVTEPTVQAPRVEGGDAAELVTGHTLLVGGRDADGLALDEWTVFAPTPAS